MQIKGSVKKKKKKEEEEGIFNPQAEKGQNSIQEMWLTPLEWLEWGWKEEVLEFFPRKKKKNFLKCFWVAACSHYNNISTQKHP